MKTAAKLKRSRSSVAVSTPSDAARRAKSGMLPKHSPEATTYAMPSARRRPAEAEAEGGAWTCSGEVAAASESGIGAHMFAQGWPLAVRTGYKRAAHHRPMRTRFAGRAARSACEQAG